MGVIAGGGTNKQLSASGSYARALGLAFQIQDDLLDMVATTGELGKPAGSDRESGKCTFATELGIEKCKKLVAEKTDEAKRSLLDAFSNTTFLCWLADLLAERSY